MTARTATSIATLLVVACLWYLFTSATGWVGSARFPNPAEFGQAVKQIALTGYADARIHQHVIAVHCPANQRGHGVPRGVASKMTRTH